MREPSCLVLFRSGELSERVEQARAGLASCVLCPRRCGADRLSGEIGFCGTGEKAIIASWNLHFGEEAPLSGTGGSGTIFFGNCNLGCLFCQNRDISHECEEGLAAEPVEIAGVMLELQSQGAHNINLVTPGHVVPQILAALPVAIEHGLSIPLVFNTSGYDEVETLRLLDGVVDIYMPDVKFRDPAMAAKYMCGAADYPSKAEAAVREMHRQTGDLALNSNGIAEKGLLVRHLVMPNGVAGTPEWMRFLASLSLDTYVNIMDQYRPCGEAQDHPEINRTVTREEMEQALSAAREAGLRRLDDRSSGVHRLLRQMLGR